jgi:hypothetical protein
LQEDLDIYFSPALPPEIEKLGKANPKGIQIMDVQPGEEESVDWEELSSSGLDEEGGASRYSLKTRASGKAGAAMETSKRSALSSPEETAPPPTTIKILISSSQGVVPLVSFPMSPTAEGSVSPV